MSPPFQGTFDERAQAEPADPLEADLSGLYALTQASRFVFASPLGPLSAASRSHFLPRFVFFGPNACDDSWRVAFLAGLDHRDPRSSRALVALVTRLAGSSELGHGLNLTFFPRVDVLGSLAPGHDRGLGGVPWTELDGGEIGLLARDARQRGYHGYVRIETGPPSDELLGIRVRGPYSEALSPDLELITSEDTRSFPVRFEAQADAQEQPGGPLSLETDGPFAPFELTLRIPGSWSDAAYQHAAVTLLTRFLRRYRAFQAYGQHL